MTLDLTTCKPGLPVGEWVLWLLAIADPSPKSRSSQWGRSKFGRAHRPWPASCRSFPFYLRLYIINNNLFLKLRFKLQRYDLWTTELLKLSCFAVVHLFEAFLLHFLQVFVARLDGKPFLHSLFETLSLKVGLGTMVDEVERNVIALSQIWPSSLGWAAFLGMVGNVRTL